MDVSDVVAMLLSSLRKVRQIHPLFTNLYPLAVLRGRELYLFEPSNNEYRLARIVTAPSWMPDTVSAALPLDVNDWRMTAVVSLSGEAILESIVSVLHEFVHCYQWECCEEKLKSNLTVAREEVEAGNYSWELNYPFPYTDDHFVELYSRFLDTNAEEILTIRKELKEYLSHKDYEYMVWQEWKEGFARYIENVIRKVLQLKENNSGREKPFTRITFYVGGEKMVKWLQSRDPGIILDIEKLFCKISGET
ncbi:MAG: hypothetical protein QXF90_08320 [Thermofilaceae archaeon]